jgi:hypothetical protein
MVQDKRVSAPLRGAETRLLRKVQDLSQRSNFLCEYCHASELWQYVKLTVRQPQNTGMKTMRRSLDQN